MFTENRSTEMTNHSVAVFRSVSYIMEMLNWCLIEFIKFVVLLIVTRYSEENNSWAWAFCSGCGYVQRSTCKGRHGQPTEARGHLF